MLEMPEELEYWPVIKYVMSQVFDKDIARLKYFKLTHDNLNIESGIGSFRSSWQSD